MAGIEKTLPSARAAAPLDPLIGQVVGEYRVEALVGRGATGIVYRATNVLIGKTVALKVLKPDLASDSDMVLTLVREARTVNAVHHPGIVDIFGFGSLPNGQPYVVMDLLSGEPLEEWIRREAPAPLPVFFRMMDELLSALSAAHEVGAHMQAKSEQQHRAPAAIYQTCSTWH